MLQEPAELLLRISPRTEPEAAVEECLGAVAGFLEELFDGDLVDLNPGLEKALPTPHHSQTQQRSRSGQFVRFHHARLQPRDEKGRFRGRLSLGERQAAAQRVPELIEQQLGPRLQEHLADFRAGRFDADEWYRRCARDIELFYELIYREGKRTVGDPAVKLSPQDRAVLGRLVQDELHYLGGFREHLRGGQGKMPWEERMALYAHAAMEAAWLGWVMGDQRKGRELRWVYGATVEHCGLVAGGKALGCSDFVQMGWSPVLKFVQNVLSEGYLPQGGKIECQGHRCLCRLEERIDGKPQPAVLLPVAPAS